MTVGSTHPEKLTALPKEMLDKKVREHTHASTHIGTRALST